MCSPPSVWGSCYLLQRCRFTNKLIADGKVAIRSVLQRRNSMTAYECSILNCFRLHPPRNPARCAQQLVLPLAPLAQLGRVDGIAAQVQEYLGSLVEAFTGKFS